MSTVFTPSLHIVSNEQFSFWFWKRNSSEHGPLCSRGNLLPANMGIAVYNISTTTARVSWPSVPGCVDTFYSVMYDPNWNSILMGYKRKRFMHEERIPVSHTSAYLANLLPQTAYFLCVTCQAANPVRDQCQVFSTLSENSEGHDRGGWQLAMGVWLTCCILLLVIAGVLLWGCLCTICSIPRQGADGCHVAANSTYQDVSGSGHHDSSNKHASNMQHPLLSSQITSRVINQDYELATLAKLSGPQPVWVSWTEDITAMSCPGPKKASAATVHRGKIQEMLHLF